MNSLLFLGVGSIARAVRQALPSVPATGTTRRSPDARFEHITPLTARDARAIRNAAEGAHIVVSFPPDGQSDREFAELIHGARRIVYLSSTAVYPLTASTITEASPVASSGERALLRLAAEATWLAMGASVVRLPAFYGRDSGLHHSLARGSFRLPGLGENMVSRVHERDAARFVCAALAAPPGSLLLAGDAEPARVRDVVEFVCELFELPRPKPSSGDSIPLSLRANRFVDNRRTRSSFGIELAYPTYREGYLAVRNELLALDANTPGEN